MFYLPGIIGYRSRNVPNKVPPVLRVGTSNPKLSQVAVPLIQTESNLIMFCQDFPIWLDKIVIYYYCSYYIYKHYNITTSFIKLDEIVYILNIFRMFALFVELGPDLVLAAPRRIEPESRPLPWSH